MYEYYKGIMRTFSTKDDAQFSGIDRLWHLVLTRYKVTNLVGIGVPDYKHNTIDYMIAFDDPNKSFDDDMVHFINEHMNNDDGYECVLDSVALPLEGWTSVIGRVDRIPEIYRSLYKKGSRIMYELEDYYGNGRCEICVKYKEAKKNEK